MYSRFVHIGWSSCGSPQGLLLVHELGECEFGTTWKLTELNLLCVISTCWRYNNRKRSGVYCELDALQLIAQVANNRICQSGHPVVGTDLMLRYVVNTAAECAESDAF